MEMHAGNHIFAVIVCPARGDAPTKAWYDIMVIASALSIALLCCFFKYIFYKIVATNYI